MPSISNAGGSLTSALALTLLAWAVRWWRDEVETEACPHLIFDIRQDTHDPLPPELKGALCIPAKDVEEVLRKPRRWAEVCGGTRRPAPSDILVFLGVTAAEQEEGAAGAAAAGYERTLALHPPPQGQAPGQGREGDVTALPRDLAFMQADALAVLMGAGGADGSMRAASLSPVTVIDVRRWDERLLFGSIRGSQALPVDELPSALQLSQAEFESRYRFPRPFPDELVVVASRCNARAVWAATLAAHAGYSRWFVLQSGHNGWRFDSNVKLYQSYAAGDAPPEPDSVPLQLPDREEGVAELAALGIF